ARFAKELKVWWPGIDAEAETLVKTCLPCQSTMPPTVPEPLRPSTMPSKPWQSIHIDLCGPFPSGESLLVCVDACSRWPEVEIIRATSSEVIIRRLQKILATHGLPEQVTSDNGSNLVSREIEDFFSSHGIYHRKVTPYWPQANATVERFNRTVEKAIRTAHVEGRDWRKALDTFLLNYRATPHAITGVSPAKIMFGREIRTKVPEISKPEKSETLGSALARDKRNKEKMQQYSDNKNRSTPSTVSEGDMVLLKQPKSNKLSTSFDPNGYRVVKRHGSSVLLQRGNEPAIMHKVTLTYKTEQSNA
ncbi:Transposon Tf2-9 poly, partial [Paramuricea clavata]